MGDLQDEDYMKHISQSTPRKNVVRSEYKPKPIEKLVKKPEYKDF